MQHVIVVFCGDYLVGVFTNLRRVYDAIDSCYKPSYSTVASHLRVFCPEDFGTCVFFGQKYSNLMVKKVTVNEIVYYQR